MADLIKSFTFLDSSKKIIDYQYNSFIIYWKTQNCWVSSYSFSGDWFQKDERYSSLNTNSMQIRVSQNTTTSRRFGWINFSVQDFEGSVINYTYTIEQASGRPLFTLDTSEVYMPNTQSSKEIGIRLDSSFNGTPTITSDSDWLSGQYTYQGTNSKININCARNVFAQRTAQLKVSYKSETAYDWMIPEVQYEQVITVIQEGGAEPPHIEFSSDNVTLDALGMMSVIISYESFEGAKIKNITTEDAFFTVELSGNQLNIHPISANVENDIRRGMIYVNITDSSSMFLTKYGIQVIQNKFDITLNPNVVAYTANGKVAEGSTNGIVIVNREDSMSIDDIEEVEGLDWVRWNYDATKGVIFITNVDVNDSFDAREGTIKLKLKTTAPMGTASLYRQFRVSQEGKERLSEEPIWKDTVITLNKNRYGDYKYYRLFNTDTFEEIYRGQLFFINDTIDINVADIAKDYINVNKNPFGNALTNNNGYINFSFDISDDNDAFEFITQYRLYYNYEYDYTDFKWNHITDPIQDYVDRRQYFIYSIQDWYNNNGDTNVILEVENAASTQQDSFKISNGQYTLTSRLNSAKSVSILTPYAVSYDVRETCCDYCLYYLNRMGGWSWLLINGTTLKNNKITTNSYNKNVSNLKSSNFQNLQYLKSIDESWKLTTEYLTDEQSKKMEDLLMSTVVYLHDLNEDRLIAVTIDETSVDVKTFDNQRHKPFLYSFTVKNSQKKYRR